MSEERLPHLLVEGFFGREKYTSTPRPGPAFPLPARERLSHGASVREQLQRIRGENEANRGVVTDEERPSPVTIEVRGSRGSPSTWTVWRTARRGSRSAASARTGPCR